jgi:hypothetical protein
MKQIHETGDGRRSVFIGIRITGQTRLALTARSAEIGCSISDIVRRGICQQLSEVDSTVRTNKEEVTP